MLLTGTFAYKIKKAVDFGFLDFTTLAARRFFCEEELRLNRRLAPDLYLDVVPITGSVDAPALGGPGPALEYAVKMREFPQDALACRLLERGQLGAADIDALAAQVADFHGAIGIAAPDGAFGAPEGILRLAQRNFDAIAPLVDTPAEREEIESLRAWTDREHAARRDAFLRRLEQGFVRECHGDLHLGNIARVDSELVIFDGIEFNASMRWIDVMSEVAFVVMDLADRARADLAHRFLDAYLERTGDYAGLAVLPFYLAYRAMVRAKIARLRATQLAKGAAKEASVEESRGYLRLARSYAAAPRPALDHHLRLLGLRQDRDFAGVAGERSAACASAATSSASACTGSPLWREATRRPGGSCTRRRRPGRPTSACVRWRATSWAPAASRSSMRHFSSAPSATRFGPSQWSSVFRSRSSPSRRKRPRCARASSGGRRGGSDASDADLAVLARQKASAEPLTAAERAFAVALRRRGAARGGARAVRLVRGSPTCWLARQRKIGDAVRQRGAHDAAIVGALTRVKVEAGPAH